MKINKILLIIVIIAAVVLVNSIFIYKNINSSKESTISDNNASLYQDTRLEQVFESTKVYRYWKIYEPNKNFNFSYADKNYFENLLYYEDEGISNPLLKYCNKELTPSNVYMYFEKGTLVVIDADTYEIKCDFVNNGDAAKDNSLQNEKEDKVIEEIDNEDDSDTGNSGTNTGIKTVSNPLDIQVTSQIVKNVDDKCRYFFDIRNDDDRNFEGSIEIELINQRGSRVWSDEFVTNRAIEPGLGTSVYTDANTCPVAIHGEYGIDTYRYEVNVNNQIVKTGSGSISNKYEVL